MNDKISIIIPAYNCEKTISRCIDSILRQTYRDYEIIIINDGSTDNTKDICGKYKSSNIKLINRINEGPSKARNIGIKEARGDFIVFVDSDDYLDENMLYCMIKCIKENKTDIAVCGYNIIRDGRTKIKLIQIKNELSFEKKIEYLYKNYLLNVVWNKIYRKSKINVYFDEDIYNGEDLLFNLEYLKNCDDITIINKNLYNYTINTDNESLSRKNTNTSLEKIYKMYNMLKEMYILKFNKIENVNWIDSGFKVNIINFMKSISMNDILSINKKEKKLKNIINKTKTTNIYNYNYTKRISEGLINRLIKNNNIKTFIYIYQIKKYFIQKIRNIKNIFN